MSSYVNMDHAGWVEDQIRAFKPQATKSERRRAETDGVGWAAAPDKLNEFQQGKIAASLAKGVVKFGVVMDDKVIMVDMAWESIRVCSEVQLAEFILKYMKDTRDNA